MALVTTIPLMEMTETSDVPPPMSQIMFPAGSWIGMSAPIAAARDSSITFTSRAPALYAHSSTARRSTSVMQLGMPMTILGFTSHLRGRPIAMKCLIIFSVVSMSAITPSRRGLMATMSVGVLRSMFLASFPTEITRFVFFSMATTDGSLITSPFPFIYTRVLQVPRSIPISVENIFPNIFLSVNIY